MCVGPYDADLYALTFPSNEFLPLCKGWAWDKMTPDDLHRSRQGKLQSWDVGFCSQHYQSIFFFLFAFSFLPSQHVRVSIAPWGERNWEGCSLIIIFQGNHHTWDDMIRSPCTSRFIHHVLNCWASRKKECFHYAVGTFLKPDFQRSISTFILKLFNLLNRFWVNTWFKCVRTNNAHNAGSSQR